MILICYTMSFPALKLKLVFNGKEQNSACILSKPKMASSKCCYCRKMWEITCNKRASNLFMPFWFGTQNTSSSLILEDTVKAVCTDLRICYFCNSCYRHLNLQRYTPSKTRSCTMHLQCYNLSLRLQLTHLFYSTKTLLKTTVSSCNKMSLLLT